MSDSDFVSVFDHGVDVVVLRAVDDLVDRGVPVAGTTVLNLADGREPTGGLLTELLASTVRVSLAEGNLPEVLRAVRDVPVPPAFRVSPWLADSRPVIVRDGIGRLAELTVRYSDESGLQIVLPHPDTDADFELGDENG